MSIESQLRETLHRAADEVGSAEPGTAVRAEGMRLLAHRRSRRRTAVLSAGLAAVLVAVLVPVGLSLLGPGADRAVTPPSVPEADIFGVPTRGSLAADPDFLEALRELPWTMPDLPVGPDDPPVPDPPIETRRVVFAGDVAAGRWALVVGQNTAQPTGEAADPDLQTDLGSISDLAALWFVGPPGATPEQMQMVSVPRGISADQPASLYNGATGALVVIAAPGDVIEISTRPEVAADGSVTRNYVDAGDPDGVAVAIVEPNPYNGMPAVQYRVNRAGRLVAEQGPDGYNDPYGTGIAPTAQLDYLRVPLAVFSEGPPTDREQQVAAEILGEYGLAADQVELRVHYVGPLPGPSGAPAELIVLTATLPSGAVLTRAAYTEQLVAPGGPAADLAYYGGSWCANDLSAAGVPAAQRVLAIRCDVGVRGGEGQTPETESTLVVIAPADLFGLTALAEGSGDRGPLALADSGIGMVPFPEGARTVVIQAADGSVLDEVSILTA